MRVDPIDSDALDGASYDAENRTLTIKFESRGLYEYYDVDPALFEELQQSQPHPWSVVGERIKAHRYRRLN